MRNRTIPLGSALTLLGLLVIALILLFIAGCNPHVDPNPPQPAPSAVVAASSSATTAQPTGIPTSPTGPAARIKPRHNAATHVASDYPHRVIYDGEYCKGTDKGTYAYGSNGDLLWCGPVDAALPRWHKANA